MLSIQIQGLDTLARELESLGSSIAESLEDAALAAGMIIQDQGDANAPFKSGTLKSSIAVWVVSREKYKVIVAVGPRGVPYAMIQEYGGVTGRGHRTRIQGKFYMTRAVEMRQKQAEDEMVRVITMGFNR
ncbi:MAG TPA: HK97 gp10 family phage protein [Methanoregulaceae archaeon]|nr:HK97 gp10 family phage protein [Methanoregulaceae archaeon]